MVRLLLWPLLLLFYLFFKVFAQQGYFVVAPNPTGSTGFGQGLLSFTGTMPCFAYQAFLFQNSLIESPLIGVQSRLRISLPFGKRF